MFGSIVCRLLDQKLTSLKELEEVTGRGTSTVYRWKNGESEPHYTDMRLLIRHLRSPDARRSILGLLTADLPVVINWVDHDHIEDEKGRQRNGHEVLEQSLLALDCLTDALAQGHDAIRERNLERDTYTSLVSQVDNAIRYLTVSKNMLQHYMPVESAGAASEPGKAQPDAGT